MGPASADSAELDRLRQAMRAGEAAANAERTLSTRRAWLETAADFYLVLHPEGLRWRSPQRASEIPSVEEIQARAIVADRANRGIPRLGRIDPDPDGHDLWAAQLGWFEEAQRYVFTDAFWAARAALQAGDRSGLEYGVRFLEADPWCFRSGYVKATLIYPIVRLELDDDIRKRLRRVVLAVVEDQRRRKEIRRYGRLAWGVGDETVRTELQGHVTAADPQIRYNARTVLAGWERIQLAEGSKAPAAVEGTPS
jgi:hypothetical protein